ncbi:MAG: RagB/SusD family nutrient uptake outer membrane protein [Dysgonamonadaceae bacterium]|nr:RagB/SusD family nutrient uptake outer membrane protein [Dysgonamonadaceae bacterium]
MKNIIRITKYAAFAAVSALVLHACMDDLDVIPEDPSIITDQIFKDNPGAYKQNLAKLYAGLAVSGPTDAGSSDIQGLDAGYGQYMRAYWVMQEVTTDEAALHWGDAGIPELVTGTWNASNQFIRAMYLRIAYQSRVTSEYLNVTGEDKLNDRGQGSMIPEVKTYRAEARFLRALSYFHAIDLFGNFGFLDENTVLGTLPEQKTRAELVDYVESELLAIIPDLKDPRTNEYGRVDRAAAWFLLAKLYLNSQVWAGKDRNADCIAMCENVIHAGYSIGANYNELFLADNDKNSSAGEYIAVIPQDGLHLQAYGCMTFIIQAATLSGDSAGYMGKEVPDNIQVNCGVGGWNGATIRPELYTKFDVADKRAMFFTYGHELDLTELSSNTKYGYGVTKFRNVTSTGVNGSHGDFVDTDYPLFRLADAYLMYAEAVVRSNGDKGQAVTYINEQIRPRTGLSDISQGDLTLDFILNERARELYWEGWRRQDLIRFGKFTGNTYAWQWKGNAYSGTVMADFRNLFPLPEDQLQMNKHLKQNPGY